MNKLFTLVLSILVISNISFAQLFTRTMQIPVPAIEGCGYGNFVAGVDFDGDGYKEIYAVNNNFNDGPDEMTPRIYKFEYNGAAYVEVWSAAMENITAQNTWPAIASGDLDKDGKMEIIWAPCNFLTGTNLSPERIIIFEEKGDGSDEMGIWLDGKNVPNTTFKITETPSFEVRPFRIVIGDPDADGKDEIIFADRQANYRFGVISVDNVPSDGSAANWTIEFSGLGKSINSSTIYDVILVGRGFAVIHQNGNITEASYENNTWVIDSMAAVIPGGSWKSASPVRINDTTVAVYSGGFLAGNNKIYITLNENDALKTYVIADLNPLTGATARIMGGTAGDIDLDGNLDLVFGSRDAKPNASIVRVEYKGTGDIKLAENYTVSFIDTAFAAGGRWDAIAIANVDGDPMNEVIYTNGVNGKSPIIITDINGQLPVELKSFTATATKNNVSLAWSTSTETNNKGYEVQRKSVNGEYAYVTFIRGNGTTTSVSSYSFTDQNVASGKYSYRLKQVDYNGTISYSNEIEVDVTPADFTLGQNYPNPFNPSTSISFGLPTEGMVTLKVYSIIGEEVATIINNQLLTAGNHTVSFDASKLSSGMYIYQLNSNGKTLSKKMNLMK